MPASYRRAAGFASVLGGTFVLLGLRYVGDTSRPLSATGGLTQRLVTVITWSWHIVIGAWLLLRPVASPLEA
jgi:hypothetical protein